MFAVKNGQRPPKSPPQTYFEGANMIWSLIEDCWAQSSEQRPTASDVVQRIRFPGGDTRRSRSSDGIVRCEAFTYTGKQCLERLEVDTLALAHTHPEEEIKRQSRPSGGIVQCSAFSVLGKQCSRRMKVGPRPRGGIKMFCRQHALTSVYNPFAVHADLSRIVEPIQLYSAVRLGNDLRETHISLTRG